MPEPTEIRLAPSEILSAGFTGLLRYANALRLNARDFRKGAHDPLTASILGACGEAAVGKVLGVWWAANADVDFKGRPDLTWRGHKLEVRTRSKPEDALYLKEDDLDDRPYILVLAHAHPSFLLAGWVYAREGKTEEFRWTPADPRARPGYLVPQRRLRAFGDLRAIDGAGVGA